MAKWIEFREVPSQGATKRWDVVTSSDETFLGSVRRYSGWRRYCFFPDFGSFYEQDCLRDVADFIEARTREHKAARAAAKGVARG